VPPKRVTEIEVAMATLVARMLVGKSSQTSAGYIPAPIAHTLIPTAWATNRVQGWSVISRE